MEKHQLIQIIRKDIDELNEITKGLDETTGFSKFELEIAVSKSKLVYQEFEFLKELSSQTSINNLQKPEFDKPPVYSKSDIIEKIQEQELEEEITEEGSKTAGKNESPEEENAPGDHPHESTGKETNSEDEIAETNQEPVRAEEEMNTKYEEESTDLKKTVGEHFVKGKSLNDLLIEGKTLGRDLTGPPIRKLESAIGLNDRFQFTRELFNNDPELFGRMIREIDQAETLNEAVRYLNNNFKWKKTETSIQFAQLIKRRFTN